MKNLKLMIPMLSVLLPLTACKSTPNTTSQSKGLTPIDDRTGEVDDLFIQVIHKELKMAEDGKVYLIDNTSTGWVDADQAKAEKRDRLETKSFGPITTHHIYTAPYKTKRGTTIATGRDGVIEYINDPQASYVLQMRLGRGEDRGLADIARIFSIKDRKLEKMTQCVGLKVAVIGLTTVTTKHCMTYTKRFCTVTLPQFKKQFNEQAQAADSESDQDLRRLTISLHNTLSSWSQKTDRIHLERANTAASVVNVIQPRPNFNNVFFATGSELEGSAGAISNALGQGQLKPSGENLAALDYVFNGVLDTCKTLTDFDYFIK